MAIGYQFKTGMSALRSEKIVLTPSVRKQRHTWNITKTNPGVVQKVAEAHYPLDPANAADGCAPCKMKSALQQLGETLSIVA
jgi:hypothetical protein